MSLLVAHDGCESITVTTSELPSQSSKLKSFSYAATFGLISSSLDTDGAILANSSWCVLFESGGSLPGLKVLHCLSSACTFSFGFVLVKTFGDNHTIAVFKVHPILVNYSGLRGLS